MASFYMALSSVDSWERNVKVRVSNEAMKELKGFWQSIPSELLVGSFNRSLDRSIIFTDASLAGYGAHFENEILYGAWSQDEGLHHITYLELLAVKRVLVRMSQRLRNRFVTIFTDN
jgi:hypothetical protein